MGNSGVSVCHLDDAKKLYSGFDLCAIPVDLVSMTINGPAPMVLGFFMNAAIDQRCEKHIREHGLEADVEKASRPAGTTEACAPTYLGDLPEGNDGLGLAAPGRCTGDEVLAGRDVRPHWPPRPSAACAAPCKPTSSRKTRPRTPASSPPSSPCV